MSVSLDSADPGHNDRYRPAVNGRDGWAQVLSGIRTLQAARGTSPAPKIGLYTVITRVNIPAIIEVAELAAELGLDYFVPQPVSLSLDHTLHDELSLRPGDQGTVAATLRALYQSGLPVALPASPSYPVRFTRRDRPVDDRLTVPGLLRRRTRSSSSSPTASVWDCPSSAKIAATPPAARRTIRGTDAQHTVRRSDPTRPG